MKTTSHNENDELHKNMEQIRANRRKLRDSSKRTTASAVSDVMMSVRKVVEQFVEGDSALVIQSSSNQRIFIGYGYSSICQVVASEDGEDVRLEVRSEPGLSFVRSTHVSNPVEEKTVRDWTKTALLDWYATL